MGYCILVVGRKELGEVIQARLEKELNLNGDDVSVVVQQNEAGAARLLRRQPYDLLVTEDAIPADPSSPLVPRERRGLALVRSVQPAGIPAVILTTSVSGELLEEAQKLSRCHVVLHGEEGWDERLLRRCREALQAGGSAAVTPAERRAGKAEIILNLGKECWRYVLHATGIEYGQQGGDLQVNLKVIQDLLSRSENVGQVRHWERELQRIGETLMQEIFGNNLRFVTQFFELVGKVGGIENMTIEFHVERTIHGVALEALCQSEGAGPEQHWKYWMLTSPMYRRLDGGGGLPALFEREAGPQAPLNCLIIESDVSGEVKEVTDAWGRPLQLHALRNVKEEGPWLYQYLDGNREAFNIRKVERVAQPAGGLSFWGTVKAVADRVPDNEGWDIVHYAGHSYCQEQCAGREPKHRGLFFFPGSPIEVVSAETFSRALRRPRFVYLSSCQSSEASFVFELAEQNAASILGFRWDIADGLAVRHARQFYEALFQKRSLDYAFLKARQEMHAVAPEDRTWAAPILMR